MYSRTFYEIQGVYQYCQCGFTSTCANTHNFTRLIIFPELIVLFPIVSSFESLSSLVSLRMNPFLEMTLLLVIANSFTKYGGAELNDKIKKNIVTGNDRNALKAKERQK